MSGLTQEQKDALEVVNKAAEAKATEVAKQHTSSYEAELKQVKEALETLKSSVAGTPAEVDTKVKVVMDRLDKMSMEYKKRSQIEKDYKQSESFTSLINKAVEENEDAIEKFARKETRNLVLELKAVGDISTTSISGGDNYGRIVQDGMAYLANRKAYVSDLIAQGKIGPGNEYWFMRETAGEGNVAPHKEGALKSQFDMRAEEVSVPVETIAGWTRVTRKAMQNIPGFTSWLQVRIPDIFKKELDRQVLYGTGADNELKGIMTAGNHKALTNTATPLVEKLMDAITLLEDDFERDATIGFLRPVQYNSFFKNKAAGSGEYDLPEGITFVNGVLYVFGVPFYKTTALNKVKGDFLVGQANGAQLLTQNPMRIEFFDQDGDNVRTNRVTVRVEGDYALPVYADDYWVAGTSNAPVGG